MGPPLGTREIVEDPPRAAKIAGLRYVTDSSHGISRRRFGPSFRYFDSRSKPIRSPAPMRRIKALAIPPAWTNVWICPTPQGHLQATGRDARGRKQYRYHPRWREVRDGTKYARMRSFGRALPILRARVERDLALPSLPRDKVLATVVRLLDTTFMRVGNEEYARANGSFGLTTLRNRHVRVAGSALRFHFRSKRGKEVSVHIDDRRLARIVKRCQELPGHELFQYIDDAGGRQSINSADVNDYLRMVTRQDFTAKDFRTWTGTVLATAALRQCLAGNGHIPVKQDVLRAIQAVADRLGNTPAICRKCYIHPAVIGAYLDGSFARRLRRHAAAARRASPHRLSADEMALLRFLEPGTPDAPTGQSPKPSNERDTP